MAFNFTSSTASSLDTLHTKVRDIVGDTETTAANQRWADSKITDAINHELIKMGVQMGISDPGPALTSANVTYTADADTVALSEALKIHPIVKVEDITDSANVPIRMERVSFQELERFVAEPNTSARSLAFSIVGDNIAIRPKPGTARTIRFWYLRGPYVLSADADNHEVWVGNEELIILGAAIRLTRTDQETPAGMREDYNDHWLRFLATCKRFRGNKTVGKHRRWR